MAPKLPKHLLGAWQEELVMLRIIQDMSKASGEVFFQSQGEEHVQKRLGRCDTHDFEDEVQESFEKDLTGRLHSYFLFHQHREIFSLRAKAEESKKAKEAQAQGEEQTDANSTALKHGDISKEVHDQNAITAPNAEPVIVPTITTTPPATDVDQTLNDYTNAENENEPTDFTDSTNALTSIPQKGDKDRKKLWTNLEINGNVLEQVDIIGKDGRFFASRASIAQLSFDVSIKEASIRPIVVFDFKNEQSIKNARTLADSTIASQYLTQPPMPVLVTLKFPKASNHPAFKKKQHASVNAELAPATIGQIAKAAVLLYATQEQHWEDVDETWKWEAMVVSKKGAKGEVKEIQSLMRSNPVFVRMAKPATSSMASAQASTPQQSSVPWSTTAADHGNTDESADEQVENSGEKGQKELKGSNDTQDDEEEETGLSRGGGLVTTAWAFVRKFLRW